MGSSRCSHLYCVWDQNAVASRSRQSFFPQRLLISLPSTVICRPIFNMLLFVRPLSHFRLVFLLTRFQRDSLTFFFFFKSVFFYKVVNKKQCRVKKSKDFLCRECDNRQKLDQATKNRRLYFKITSFAVALYWLMAIVVFQFLSLCFNNAISTQRATKTYSQALGHSNTSIKAKKTISTAKEGVEEENSTIFLLYETHAHCHTATQNRDKK